MLESIIRGANQPLPFGLTVRDSQSKVLKLSDSDYPTCERTYATLRIYPGEIDPADVTRRLALQPSHSQRRGERTRPNVRPAPLHGWFLSSESAVDSQDVRKHLDWLISSIAPKVDILLALQDEACKMDVSCYWVSRSGHGGPSVRPAQMRELARLNLELWFDVYLGDRRPAKPANAWDEKGE